MKRLLFVLFLMSIPALLLAEEPVREWKFKSGNTIIVGSLDLTRNIDPEMVYFLKDGKRYKVPFKNLSQADQEYVTRARAGVSNPDERFGLVEDQTENANVRSGQKYALLIGVNKYAKPFKSLKYSDKDMELLAECFQKSGTPKKNIILVTDNASSKLRPTGENIRRLIETITKRMGADSQLIIVFRGQGTAVDGKLCLCPGDANAKDVNSVIARDWVIDQLKNCKAKDKLFIYDASQSDTSFDSDDAPEDVPSQDDVNGLVLISACNNNQQSWEDSKLQHGVFMNFLAEGLSGAAKDKEDSITVSSVFDYANYKTKMFVYNKFDESQTPTINSEIKKANFCLVKVDNPNTQYKAGERKTFKVNGVEFAFRYCPPGTFIMGAPKEEIKDMINSLLSSQTQPLPQQLIVQQVEMIAKYEKQHQVTLTQGFWIMETEVTVGMFKAFVNDTGYVSRGEIPNDTLNIMASQSQISGEEPDINSYLRLYLSKDAGINPWRNPGFPQDDSHPVICISWNDAVEFCKWLSKKTGQNIHLPTEAQWEYACRAGTTGAVAGNLDEMAWYTDLAKEINELLKKNDEETYKKNFPLLYLNSLKTHPVGKKKPNAWGLYDMHGNVREWCQDRAGFYPDGSVTDPTGPSVADPYLRQMSEKSSDFRTVRGTGSALGVLTPRSAARWMCDQKDRLVTIGFRCVMGQSND